MNPSLLLPTLTAALPKLTHFGLLLAQSGDGETVQQVQQSPAGGAFGGIVGLLFAVVAVVSLWKIFTKAGRAGWESIIPIYNLYVLLKIAGKPGWWLILLLIPFVNFIIIILMFVALAKAFGKGAGFGIGLALLGIIFLPILAFGDARYQGYGATPPPLM